MEKKNNQMVDKEKELKNVAPDTDVAPDVTDASSFQGEPSHPSSNRQQMRLINRIDYYKWKINLLTELISVERENLEKSRDNRTGAFKERQRRKIFPLKLKASDVDEAVEELYGRDIEKFDKRQKLNFREYRQNLRRAEGLLNPEARSSVSSLMRKATKFHLKQSCRQSPKSCSKRLRFLKRNRERRL